jgi:hypothetical protein
MNDGQRVIGVRKNLEGEVLIPGPSQSLLHKVAALCCWHGQSKYLGIVLGHCCDPINREAYNAK